MASQRFPVMRKTPCHKNVSRPPRNVDQAAACRRRGFVPGVCAALAVLLLDTALSRAADEIHWTITGPTSVSFGWRGCESFVRYGTTTAYGRVMGGIAPSPTPQSSPGPFWEARITGLRENTLYHYSIGSGPDHTFRTPPVRGSSGFTAFVAGDIGDSSHYSRVADLQTMIAAAAPELVLMVGDLTYGNDKGQGAVDRHFNDVMKWSQDAAYMPAWGNHEWDSPGSDDLRNYKGRFDLPNPRSSPGAPTPPGPGEDWYWFDYGNVRFIAYPEPYTSASWSDWNTRADSLMDAAQADPSITFIVTFGHRPAYSSGHHPGASSLAGYMGTLGAQHSKYKLNINGHSHNYERTYPQSGVIHLTVGDGGSSHEIDQSGSCSWLGGCPPPSYTAYRAFHHSVIKLRFTTSAIEGTAVCGPAASGDDVACTSGSAMDTFVIPAPGGDLVPPSRSTNVRTRP